MDTHRDAHVAAVLSVMGTVLATDEFPATAAGYRDLLKWARGLGVVGRAGVEGTGSYGASLSRYLLAQGVDVLDVNRMDRADRRRRGKSDPLDAQNAARAILSGRARARAKSGDGPVQIARMYKLTKASAVKARTQAINQLKAVLITADPALREELAGLGNAELFRTCARFADASAQEEVGEETVLQATRITLGLLAHRIGQLSEQIRDLDTRLTRLVNRYAPQLLDVVGIGPDTAVTLLITVGDNPERLASEASFAALCGVSPVERSSGRRQYCRLNRSGDRQANAALHRIVFTRLRVDSRTQEYYERRIKEGKTRREIVRCLKRYAGPRGLPPGRTTVTRAQLEGGPDTSERGSGVRSGPAAGRSRCTVGTLGVCV
ncbi:IS110 family transposase [Streptomyces sp. NBC_00059]|uniref:IS110 family transposase n=1 Tax=Streptomyces sp. NBC_00059 TaxID=2975635 RepID=UPI002259A76F|nr:IS110 family transposase [Streptomyces sp. NBC_00059]MCX5417602.1 IS110 family transposase [Streptomyces sp. NBC_00059]